MRVVCYNGLGLYLNLPRVYYLDLVRQFYANISNKTMASFIYLESYVKSVPIVLTTKRLFDVLGARDEGLMFEHRKYIVQRDPTWMFEITLPKYSTSWASFKQIVDSVIGKS